MENLKMEHILKIMEQFEKTSIDTLKYKNDGEEILLTKKKNGSVEVTQNQKNISEATTEQQANTQTKEEGNQNNGAEKDKEQQNETAVKQADENLVNVESPIIGTFYSSPAPGKPPFVKKGEKVNKGDVLCIVEAMKVMNKIESEHSGIVEEICLDDGQPVEYGTCLFKIKQD
jgi:acetyl-CoA carboxylase biotin carboxyl carrier protein